MIVHDLVQGTPEWHAFRATVLPASEAPVMLGVSKYKGREELLGERYTGTSKEVNSYTQGIFDKGHAYEALARPVAEGIIGQDLYPVTGSSGKHSASFDGLTIMNDIAFEHKTLNAELEQVKHIDELHLQYRIQMEQQLMVSGAEKCLFMATKWSEDGSLINEMHLWYMPDLELREKIIKGWELFEKDLAAYVPAISKAMPKAEVKIDLPTLFIHATGEITESNMDEFDIQLKAKLAEVRKIALVTDQDFSNAKEAAKLFREQVVKLKMAKEAMLSQTMTIGEAARMIDAWSEDLRTTALQLEKDVEREDLAKKAAMIKEANAEIVAIIAAIDAELSPIKLIIPKVDLSAAIKGKRNYDAMQAAINMEVSNATLAADSLAAELKAKFGWYAIGAMMHAELFPDLQSIIYKPEDDFKLLAQSRISTFLEKQRVIEAESVAKRVEEESAAALVKSAEPTKAPEPQKVPEPSNVVEMRTPPTAALRAAVVEHQSEISGFLATIEATEKTKQTVRAYLVEFVKYQVARAAKAA